MTFDPSDNGKVDGKVFVHVVCHEYIGRLGRGTFLPPFVVLPDNVIEACESM